MVIALSALGSSSYCDARKQGWPTAPAHDCRATPALFGKTRLDPHRALIYCQRIDFTVQNSVLPQLASPGLCTSGVFVADSAVLGSDVAAGPSLDSTLVEMDGVAGFPFPPFVGCKSLNEICFSLTRRALGFANR